MNPKRVVMPLNESINQSIYTDTIVPILNIDFQEIHVF